MHLKDMTLRDRGFVHLEMIKALVALNTMQGMYCEQTPIAIKMAIKALNDYKTKVLDTTPMPDR